MKPEKVITVVQATSILVSTIVGVGVLPLPLFAVQAAETGAPFATVVAMALQRNLFGVVVLFAIYSFLMATVLVALDAVDVAMTEAAVGAGVSTVLLLSALHLTGSREAKPLHRPLLPLVFLIGGAFLVLADLLARTVVRPLELPVGVVTALVGVPLFAMLLRRSLA